jgi:hypothetical protein
VIQHEAPHVLESMSSLHPSCSSSSPKRLSTGLALLTLATLTGCNQASASSPPPSPGAPRPVITTPVAPASAAAIAAKDDISALFRAETQHRPTRIVRVEDALLAFKRAGVETSAVRQHLAKPFGAEYCAGAEAGHGVVVSLCEYASPAAASTGRSASAKGLGSIPNREIVQNGATTLTLREQARTPESHALVERMKRAFAALKA